MSYPLLVQHAEVVTERDDTGIIVYKQMKWQKYTGLYVVISLVNSLGLQRCEITSAELDLTMYCQGDTRRANFQSMNGALPQQPAQYL